MKHRRFGNTDLMVSMIGLGCYGMSGAYGPGDDAESIATIHRALDLGVTHIDTAEIYGPYANEELVARALTGRLRLSALSAMVDMARSAARVTKSPGPCRLQDLSSRQARESPREHSTHLSG
mgnify:CR=1 FL=1